MTRKKTPVPTIRSSAAEYLTFVAAVGDTQSSIEMRYEDENIWLTQKMMATLYDVSVPAVNQHLKRIFTDNELEEKSVIKEYLITASDGKSSYGYVLGIFVILGILNISARYSVIRNLRITDEYCL